MPVDKDLKAAYSVLYDDRDPLKALQLYDKILTDYPGNLMGTVYKAAALEKLYYGFSGWHNDQTLENARQLLEDALKLSQARGDRSKVGLVYFRHFVHYFNDKDYDRASSFMGKCKEYGYKDDTLPMWEAELDRKLKKRAKKQVPRAEDIRELPVKEAQQPSAIVESKPVQVEEKLRTDWYQTSNDIVISLFTSRLPQSDKDVTVHVQAADKRSAEISYLIPGSSSEFQYAIKLAHEVMPEGVAAKLFTKKLEITFKKKQNLQWKTLEDESPAQAAPHTSVSNNSSTDVPLSYPSSSKKQIDWSKLDLDDENDDDSTSADAFFQKLYADADPDTKRAMMKSFIESNGTALNTNWEDVSKKRVETAPPEGMEAKSW
ncbi:hypothetical protein HG536_0H02680 [Torulaspora globosa]|uniref:CS domain-containing protein n=1 Tax=Torulaspora globosa TaxID=48254 RepID=A0A7G3ZN07_9SACH|nr:uncharacterized protein HG536_0H02680 [Torulaspora globosa]QLL34893.1 hypothetical protein HG536_0H02680 [Torulaspora globosa]